jgi:hypothetical protein
LRVLAKLSAVLDLGARAGGLGAHLREQPEVTLTELEVLARHAAHGDGGARDVLVALAFLRVTRGELALDALHALALERGHTLAARLFRRDGALRTMGAHGRLSEPIAPVSSVYRFEATVHDPRLGRIGAQLRTVDLRERLLRDPRADVVLHLLSHDALSLADVVRIAARRPSTPAIARTIAASRWLGHQRVREALVCNPYAETWLSMVLLPTVRRGICRGAHVDPELVQLEAELQR